MARPIPPPDPPPPLRQPGRALPPVRYLPGRGPHPFRHPAGHLYAGGAAPVEAPWSPTDWPLDPRWDHGLDLFDHRYYWESHEALEALWHFLPRPAPEAQLAQGLIQIAAALIKRHLGEERGAGRLHERGLGRIEALGEGVLLGVELAGTRRALREAWEAGGWPLLARP